MMVESSGEAEARTQCCVLRSVVKYREEIIC
jgi:hypothetical protein